ncbi:hypothetical protein ACFL4J_00125 [Candidatus Margulisiibacteriota bacterium]
MVKIGPKPPITKKPGPARIRKEGAMRGFITGSLKIAGELVRFPIRSHLVVTALIEDGKVRQAADHCLELAEHGLELTGQQRADLLVRARDLFVQAGNTERLSKVTGLIVDRAAELKIAVAHTEQEADLLLERGEHLKSADIYLELGSWAKAGEALKAAAGSLQGDAKLLSFWEEQTGRAQALGAAELTSLAAERSAAIRQRQEIIAEVGKAINIGKSFAGQRENSTAAERLFRAGHDLEQRYRGDELDKMAGLREKLLELWQLCVEQRVLSAERARNERTNKSELGLAAYAQGRVGAHLKALGRPEAAAAAFRSSFENNLAAGTYERADFAFLKMLEAEKDGLKRAGLADKLTHHDELLRRTGKKQLRRIDERLSLSGSVENREYLAAVRQFWLKISRLLGKLLKKEEAAYASGRAEYAAKLLT